MNFLVKNNKMRLHLNWALSLSAVSAILSGCGGVVGEAPITPIDPANPTGRYTLSQPEKLSANPVEGTPSNTILLKDYGSANLSLDTETIETSTFYGVTANIPYGAQAHMTDVTPNVAWKDGWTGRGTRISIIDDFYASPVTTTVPLTPVIRKKDFSDDTSAYTADYKVTYQMQTSITHGELVSATAGGGVASARVSKEVALTVKSDNSRVDGTCVIKIKPEDTNYTCGGSFHEGAAASITGKLDIRPAAGVAVDALVIPNTVNLSAAQDPLKTVANIQGHLKNSATPGIDVINFSLGSEIPTNNLSFSEVMATVDKLPLTEPINAVITVAAGNGGTACAADNLNGCNAIAVSLAFQAQTKASTIVVGALTGAGREENITAYSTRGGILANRFILAHGDTGFYPDVKGTSFAAPRVAGVAAILKQKFPALSSAQIASIILLSANKDIDNDGLVDFVGVSPIFGHGKLDLARALALAGAL